MSPDLSVDVDALRRCATDLTGTAARVADGVAQSPPLGVAAFGWATANALAALETAADRRFARLAAAITDTARQLAATAEEYESVDARAAARLRATGR